MDPAPVSDPRPTSATDVTTAALIAFAMVGTVAALWAQPAKPEPHVRAMIILGAMAVAASLPAIARAVLAAARGGARAGAEHRTRSWSRTFTKTAGLAGTVGTIGGIYWLLPEYASGGSFYQPFWAFLRLVAPWWALLAVPYLHLADRRMDEPHDGLWHAGCAFTGRWGRVDRAALGQHALGWLVKAFFVPLMFCHLCRSLGDVMEGDPARIASFGRWYEFGYASIFLFDLCLTTLGYLFALRLLGTQIRSTEPTFLGWAVALVCYEPFFTLVKRSYLSYEESGFMWGNWLWDHPAAYGAWGTAILLLLGIYLWATVAFGARFSNLTNRGIITGGPYRWTKHPAYISKNLAWWMISIPFIPAAGTPSADVVRHCVMLLGINAIYLLRAKTEERHLRLDPDYVAYEQWIERQGALRWVNRVPVVGWIARTHLK